VAEEEVRETEEERPSFWNRGMILLLIVFPIIGILLGSLGWIAYMEFGPADWAKAGWNIPGAALLGAFTVMTGALMIDRRGNKMHLLWAVLGIALGAKLMYWSDSALLLAGTMLLYSVASGAYRSYDMATRFKVGLFDGEVRGWQLLVALSVIPIGAGFAYTFMFENAAIGFLLSGPLYLGCVFVQAYVGGFIERRLLTEEQRKKYNAEYG